MDSAERFVSETLISMSFCIFISTKIFVTSEILILTEFIFEMFAKSFLGSAIVLLYRRFVVKRKPSLPVFFTVAS